MDPLIVIFGLGVGFLVGTTGMGGGSLMTPLLILFAGISPVVSIASDIAYAAVTKTVGGIKHFRQGSVDLGMAKWLAVGSIPGALIGVWLLDRLHEIYGKSFDEIVLVLIAGALLLTGALVLWRALFNGRVSEQERTGIPPSTKYRVLAVLTGLIVGLILGVTSAGSGTLIAISLILIFQLKPIRLVGTDVFHAAILLWTAAVAHLFSGNIDFGLVGNILIGSIPGVWIGSHVAPKLPENGLRPALGIVLTASAFGLFKKAGVDLSPVTLILIPIALAVLSFVVHNTRKRRDLVPAHENV